ncbi:MAG: hypothetical protein JOZ02_04970 [Acidobacteria bacterium]|nr:hypothetical protein [Acidobacteriota bacterium]
MLKAARTSVLILLLACSARAGYMQTGGSPATPPPPEPVPVEQEPADATGKPVTNVYMLGEAADGLTQAALDVLAVLPALL